MCDFIGGARWRKLVTTESGYEMKNGLFHPADGERWVASRMGDLDADGTTDVVVVSRQFEGYEKPGEESGVFQQDNLKVRLYYGPFESMEVRPGELDRFTEITVPDECREWLQINALADMNGDRQTDLVLTSGTRTLIFYQNDGGGFSPDARPDVVVEDSDRRTHVADVNGDGHKDLVVCRPGAEEIDVLMNGGGGIGAGSTEEADQRLSSPGVQPMGVADLNGDGLSDIAARNREGLVIYFNLGGRQK